MSAITRKVEWMKLRELRKDEQELVRKRYNLRGPRMNTQKVQVIYTDQRIDSHHAPDCAFPSEEAARATRIVGGTFYEVEMLDLERLAAWAGKPLREEVGFSNPGAAHWDHYVYVPAPCECGVVRVASEVIDGIRHTYAFPEDRFVRAYMGLCATKGTPKAKKLKGELPTLIRFVHRPLTLAEALEYEEVDDVGALHVFADLLLECGDPFGKVLALTLSKYTKEAA